MWKVTSYEYLGLFSVSIQKPKQNWQYNNVCTALLWHWFPKLSSNKLLLKCLLTRALARGKDIGRSATTNRPQKVQPFLCENNSYIARVSPCNFPVVHTTLRRIIMLVVSYKEKGVLKSPWAIGNVILWTCGVARFQWIMLLEEKNYPDFLSKSCIIYV